MMTVLVRGTLGEVYTLSELSSFSKQTILCGLMEGIGQGCPRQLCDSCWGEMQYKKIINLNANDAKTSY